MADDIGLRYGATMADPRVDPTPILEHPAPLRIFDTSGKTPVTIPGVLPGPLFIGLNPNCATALFGVTGNVIVTGNFGVGVCPSGTGTGHLQVATDEVISTDPNSGSGAVLRLTGGIAVANTDTIRWWNGAASVGYIVVDSTPKMRFAVGSTEFVALTSSALFPTTAFGISSGTNVLPWLNVHSNSFQLFTNPGLVRISFLSDSSGNAGMDHGRQDGSASTPFIRFHSGASAVSWDSELIASGGTGSNGGGVLDFSGAVFRSSSEIRIDTTSGNASYTFYLSTVQKAGLSVIAADVIRFTDSAGTVKFQLKMGGTAGALVPPSTSFSLRNNADNADNLILLDAGDATFRTNVSLPNGFLLYRPGTAAQTVKAQGVVFASGGQTTTNVADTSVIAYSYKANTLIGPADKIRSTAYVSTTTQNGSANVKWGTTVLVTQALTAGVKYWIIIDLFRDDATATHIVAKITVVTEGTGAVYFNAVPTDSTASDQTLDFRGSVTAGGTLSYTNVLVEHLSA